MEIYITGDLHGDLRRFQPGIFYEQESLTKEDIVHGITGKGNDLDKLLTSEGFVQWLADGTLGDVPAYVLIPQLPSDKKD